MKEIYTYKDGREVELPLIETPTEYEKCFKINLPPSQEEAKQGKGEGIWACGTDETLDSWSRQENGVFFVKLMNTSTYYPSLKRDTIIPVMFRETERPVAFFTELIHHYGEPKRNQVTRFLENGQKK